MSGKRGRTFLRMIKLEHSIFALPFAYVGMVAASKAMLSWAVVLWVTAAMVGARTVAMACNRIIDARIDRANPRTAHRAIASGALSVRDGWIGAGIACIVLVVATAMLPPLCMQLLPIALFFLIGYAYTKRWTWLCHGVLGATIGMAPLGGWIAVTGSLSEAPWVLWGAVALWIAGFDIVYAIQDVDFDRAHGVCAIPARFGVVRARMIARMCHAVSIGLLGVFGVLMDFGLVYVLGVAIAAVLLASAHMLVRTYDITRLRVAFFPLNGAMGMIIMGLTILDRWVR